MSEEVFPSANARRLTMGIREERRQNLTELAQRAKMVRVTASVTFEAYALTEGFGTGKSMEQRVSEEIAAAIGYHAPNGSDLEPGDCLIVMANASPPDFAVTVTDIDVQPLLSVRVDPDLVVEEATDLTRGL